MSAANSPYLVVTRLSIPASDRWPIVKGLGSRTKNVCFEGSPPNSSDVIWANTALPPLLPTPDVSIPCAPRLHRYGNGELGIEVVAHCKLPADWTAGFKLQLSHNGILLESAQIIVTAMPGGLAGRNLTFDSLNLVTPSVATIAGPFRSDGPWTAKLVWCQIPGSTAPAPTPAKLTIQNARDIPLNMFFFVGRPGFMFWPKGGHRLEIIRKSTMSFAQYSTLPATPTRAEYETLALRVIASSVWSFGAGSFWHYDILHGASRLGLAAEGGKLILRRVFEAGRVNCYDTAAVGQAWCASLGYREPATPTSSPSPVLDFTWVFSGNFFGYVTEGPLIGWVDIGTPIDVDIQRCNSPFWETPPQIPHYGPLELKLESRDWFGKHSWTEVVRTNVVNCLVLETCHATIGNTNHDIGLAEGTVNRATWLARAVDNGYHTEGRKHKFQPTAAWRSPPHYFKHFSATNKWLQISATSTNLINTMMGVAGTED